MSIHQRTPDTNVVLFLSHLGRDANADLVKPLIAAAVTLDPVHLQASGHRVLFHFSIQSLKTQLPLWKHSVKQHLFGHLCCLPAKCPFGNVVLSEAIISLTNKLLAPMQIKYYFSYVPSCAQQGWHSKGKCCVSVMSNFCNFDITDFGKNLT